MKFQVNSIWRIITIFLVGCLVGVIIGFYICKQITPEVIPGNKVEVKIDKIKNSDSTDINVISDQDSENTKKKKFRLFK